MSGSATKTLVDLDALVSDERADCGVPVGSRLREFALDVVRGGPLAALTRSRELLLESVGAEATVDAAAVVAFFNAFDRVADATGTDPDPPVLELIGEWLPKLSSAPQPEPS